MQQMRIKTKGGGRMVKEICVLGFLGLNALTDLRRKEISLIAAAVFGGASLAWMIYEGGVSWGILIPLGISAFLLTVSILSRGAFGMGDVWLILALGIAMETEEFITMLLLGFLGSGVWAGILLVIHRKKDTEIPFVPFLLLGYIGGALL